MAFGSVSDILLRITGDPDDAAHAIEEVAADLATFGKIEAEADATINTAEAKAELDVLKERLQQFDLEEVEPKVKVKIVEALAEIAAVQAELDKMDGENVDVDIDVHRGALERINALGKQLFGTAGAVRGLSKDTEGLASSFSSVGVIAGPFTARLGEIGQLVAALSPIIVSLIGALVALAASAIGAAAGLGALAIAFGGVFAVGLGAGIAAVIQFKKEADTAGTPANKLKTALQGIGDVAKKLLPAINPIFTALADGVKRLPPLINAVVPAFKVVGRAAADSIGQFVKIVTSPQIGQGLALLTASATQAFGPLAQIAGQLFRIFLNIANAAMPRLVGGLRDVAKAMKDFGNTTSDAGKVRGVINDLIDVLGVWLQLIGNVGKALFGLFKGSEGPGTQLVKLLADGAGAISDFLNSAQGQNRLKQFFADTMPLVEQLVKLVAGVALAFIQFGEAIAPVLTPTVAALVVLVGVVNQLLAAFLSIPAPIRTALLAVLGIAVALLTGIGELTAAVLIVVGALSLLSAAASKIGPALSAIGGAATAAGRALISGIAAGANAIPGVIQAGNAAALGAIRAAGGAIGGAARAVGQALLSGIRSGASAVAGVVRAGNNAALSATRAAAGAMAGAARAVGNALVSGVRSGASAVGGAVRGALSAAVGAARGFVGQFASIGSAIIQAMASGIASAAGSLAEAAANAVKSALDKAKSLLPGSEPKDPTSPMRHLDKSGEAIILNTVKGITRAGPMIAQAVRDALTVQSTNPATAALGMPSTLALATAGVAPRAAAGAVTNNFTIVPPAGEQPDAETTLAMLDMKMRARGS